MTRVRAQITSQSTTNNATAEPFLPPARRRPRRERYARLVPQAGGFVQPQSVPRTKVFGTVPAGGYKRSPETLLTPPSPGRKTPYSRMCFSCDSSRVVGDSEAEPDNDSESSWPNLRCGTSPTHACLGKGSILFSDRIPGRSHISRWGGRHRAVRCGRSTCPSREAPCRRASRGRHRRRPST